MKTTVLICLLTCLSGASVFCQSGYLDNTFNGTGILRYNVPTATKDGSSAKVAMQADGNIVSAGSYRTEKLFFVSRTLGNGTPDTAFGNKGFVKISNPNASDGSLPFIEDLLIQPDRKILVLAELYDGFDVHSSMFRLNANGTADESFGVNGSVQLGDSLYLGAFSFALQKDGKILVLGRNYNSNIIRFTRNGSVDSSFGFNGSIAQTTVAPYRSLSLTDIAVDSKGRIICSGQAYKPSTNYSIAVAYLPNGKPDRSFASNGLFSSSFGFANIVQRADFVKILAGDKILLGGINNYSGLTPQASSSDILLAQLNSDGSADTAFGNNGLATRHFARLAYVHVQDMAVDGNGAIMFTGTPYADVAFWRFTANGSIDSSFADKGELIYPQSANNSREINAIAFQSDNKLVGVGDYKTNATAYCLTLRLLTGTAAPAANDKITITSAKGLPSLRIFPNPAPGYIVVSGLEAAKKATLRIVDMAGKQVRLVKSQSSFYKINISDLQPGMYYMQISTGDTLICEKFMKQ